jgi:CubicO group peptidase (beta-lactamase class C family)
LFTFFRDEKKPVISPWRNAVYSDGGFAILGQVLVRLSGKTFTEAIQEIIFDPIGMDSTSTKKPKGSDLNVIDRSAISNSTSWGLDSEIVASYVPIYILYLFPYTARLTLTFFAELVAFTPTVQTFAPRVSPS